MVDQQDALEPALRNPDGSIDDDAVLLNLDTRSRTFNDNERFFIYNNGGSFNPASGFTNLGGIGLIPSRGGGVPQLTDDGGFTNPFDAYSIRVQFSRPVANFVIDLRAAAADNESVLMYGLDYPIPTNEILTDGDSRLVFNVVPEPGSLLFGVIVVLAVQTRRRR